MRNHQNSKRGVERRSFADIQMLVCLAIMGLPGLALFLHGVESGFNSMISVLPTWALIVATAATGVGCGRGVSESSNRRLLAYGVVIPLMALTLYITATGMEFVSTLPVRALPDPKTGVVVDPATRIAMSAEGLSHVIPIFLAWACVVVCVVLAVLPTPTDKNKHMNT